LAQGGEFAFVLFTFAQGAGVIPNEVTAPLTVVVALSMAVTPLLLMLGQSIMVRADVGTTTQRAPEIETGHHDVIIAGYGRFGQVVGRVMTANGFSVSVLDHDADQVEVLRGFGRKVNYGDATRLDLLRIAGAGEAQLLVVAIDNQEKSLELVETARKAFPNLKIVARAFDRRHAYELMTRKVDGLERETFAAGVRLAVKSMRLLGRPAYKSDRAGKIFMRYDERILEEMFTHWTSQNAAEYQRIVRDRTALEEELIARDSKTLLGRTDDDQWGETSDDREAFEKALATKSGT
jgi:glutathione-regulated potassium-efflux system ancillary protein KefC